MSSQSQLYWAHSVAKPVLSQNSIRYSITLRSTSRSNCNSTIIIGDSNTHNVRFYYENRRSDLGKDIYGKRVKAYTVDEINPADAIGFRNVLVHVGVNNLKNKYALSDSSIDVDSIFYQWLLIVIQIKQLCPYSRLIVSPILPTKIRALNDRARRFNNILFTCKNSFWFSMGFDCFLDNSFDVLDDNFTRYHKFSEGPHRDRIHLGRRGISKLCLLIRDAVLQPKVIVAGQSYSSVVRRHPPMSINQT